MKLISFLLFPSLIAAHGYLSSPPPRGIQKVTTAIDDLKSPNHKGLCRGEPPGQVTSATAGGQLTLGLTITAPHTGPCQVSLLSYPDLKFEQNIASKYDCAAPGKVAPWTITLPSGVSGRKVLRWYWEGHHVSPPEPYEQCIDLNFGGGGGGGGGSPAPSSTRPSSGSQPMKKRKKKKKKKKKMPQHYEPPQTYNEPTTGDAPPAPSYAPAPSYTPPPSYAPAPSYGGGGGGGCTHGQYVCAGQGFKVCNWGTWIPMPCGPGTRCMPMGDSIVCG
jgi:hypothetical protein